MSDALHGLRARSTIHVVVEVGEELRLAHGRPEDDRGARARELRRASSPASVDGHARGGERHRRAAPHAPLLGLREVVARLEVLHLAGELAPERARRRTTRPGEMPLLPAASARKNASSPEPDGADDADAGDEHARDDRAMPRRLIALRRCTGEQRRPSGAKSASRAARATHASAAQSRAHLRAHGSPRLARAPAARSTAAPRCRPACASPPRSSTPSARSRRGHASAASSSCARTGPSASARSTTSHAEAERRGAHLAARGLAQGRPPRAWSFPTATSSSCRSSARSSRASCRCPSTRSSRFKNIEGYHDTVAHIARASGATMLLTTAGDAAVRRARARRASTTLRVDRRRSTSSPASAGPLDVDASPRTISRSSSSRAAAPRAPRASWSPTATSPRTPRRS